MKYLIIEDELPAAKRLDRMVQAAWPGAERVGTLDSVEEGVDWFKGNSHPDLVFLDIQLADGLSFEIFNQTTIESSVIFTTAFDEYAVKAFRVNGLDYLLKPIVPAELEEALDKYRNTQLSSAPDFGELTKMLQVAQNPRFKERFLIRLGEQYRYVWVKDVAWFQSAQGSTEVMTREGKKWILDHTLEGVKEQLDPQTFFQINRKMILHIHSIQKISTWFNHRLKLEIHPQPEQDVIVARDRVNGFKKWLDQ